jgi:hypothetical protein
MGVKKVPVAFLLHIHTHNRMKITEKSRFWLQHKTDLKHAIFKPTVRSLLTIQTEREETKTLQMRIESKIVMN